MQPQSERELAEIIRAASGPLSVVGGGTRWPVRGACLETGALRGVRLYEPGALTLVVGAGTPLDEVEAVLAEAGQRLAFEPPRWALGLAGRSTIGGVVATNASGPRRVQAGACRDALLGLRFVTGRGEVVASGGRVMKNVTGYDLVRLLSGSRGSLGVITEVSLKTAPLPEAEATLAFERAGLTEAVVALSAALGSPYEVSGAAVAEGRCLLRVEGLAASVAYRAGRLQALFGGALMAREESRALWATLRDLAPLEGKRGEVLRLSCLPSEAPALAAALDAPLLDWGGGLVWARVPAMPELPPFKGHAALWTGPEARPEAPGSPAVAALTRGLRAQFDPRGLFGGAG